MKVNGDVSATELGLIDNLYKVTIQIKNALPKATKGGTCHGSGCAERQKAMQALSKWLEKQAKSIKAKEIKLADQLVVTQSQCK